MKNAIYGLATLFFAITASAQFMPPARDLNDVQRLTMEYQRLTTAAIAEPTKYADALVLIASVHSTLRNEPAPQAIDDALDKIGFYMQKHEKDEPPLPKDIVRYVNLVKTWLEDAKMGPSPNLLALREQIHHEVVHPLQRYLLMQLKEMQTVSQMFQAMARNIDARIGYIADAVASGSPEKP